MVRCVASVSGLAVAPGEQDQRGILANRQSRAASPRDPCHRLGFHYTPEHRPRLKQSALWLSIPVRKLRRRGSSTSGADLQRKVPAFIASDNRTMAKPFRWTDQGKALVAYTVGLSRPRGTGVTVVSRHCPALYIIAGRARCVDYRKQGARRWRRARRG